MGGNGFFTVGDNVCGVRDTVDISKLPEASNSLNPRFYVKKEHMPHKNNTTFSNNFYLAKYLVQI